MKRCLLILYYYILGFVWEEARIYKYEPLGLIRHIVVILWVTPFLFFALRKIYVYVNGALPQQLSLLVHQAHMGQPFRTRWIIVADESMRNALQQPFTPERIRAMTQAGDDVTGKAVDCYVLTHRLRPGELSGVVKVSIDIKSRSRRHDYHAENVRLRVTLRPSGDHKGLRTIWMVSGVEVV